MKLTVIAITVLHLARGASIVDVTCPDSCTCEIIDEQLETSCASYEFIKKLLPKQEASITSLAIKDASLVNVDLKLKYLKNLQSLDLSDNIISILPLQFPYLPKLKSLNLSNNRLTEISFAHLPKNLQTIDLSHNGIKSFPKDWSDLKQLKMVHLRDNKIDCDCDNLLIYEQLLKEDIVVPKQLTCFYPEELHGQFLDSINCSSIEENFANSMLGDEPGSGLEDLQENLDGSSHPLIEDEEEFINAEGFTTEHVEAEEEEGSGEEGSGYEIPILPIPERPKACNFNCSTPKPIGLDDEKDASEPPGLREEVNMVWSDLLESDKEISTTPPIIAPIETKVELKEVSAELNKTSDKEPVTEEVVTFLTNDTVIGEMERASLQNSNNQSVYIIVGLLIAFVALFIIYYVRKKKAQKRRPIRRNKTNENGVGEELKPLGKSLEVTKPDEQKSKLPESAPLLNGQNGKLNHNSEESDELELENVELRKPDLQESLTPQPERVTIKAGELPDSIPKTPLLVHRQLNSDGEIVTTAVNSN